ncbi:DUF5798 family protein [Haloplanus halobius]|uniref:DUF5798 family protein n=1 Tax=Haloplanus halobius TaxID=2934938 RepID=UPI00200EA8FD|nr:DUF5798 family protein [Haloplanus sp. XH21]
MGFGSTAKKLQQVTDMAEDVYTRLNKLREQVDETRDAVDETRKRVDDIDRELAEQRAILDAIATEQGIDVETLIAEAHVVDAEEVAGEENDEQSKTGSDA